MALPLLALLPAALKTIAKITGLDIVGKAGDVLASTQLSPEKQAELQQAMLAHEAQMKALGIEEMKAAMSESMVMLGSDDKYVKRARPTGLYIFYAITAAIAVGMLLGVEIDPTAVLTILAPLAGVGGTYVYRRTTEKLGGNGG